MDLPSRFTRTLQPELVKVTPKFQYRRYKYYCACKPTHYWYGYFDQSPDEVAFRNSVTGKTEIIPRRCPGGNPWLRDFNWSDGQEAANYVHQRPALLGNHTHWGVRLRDQEQQPEPDDRSNQ